jgi:hypothetical protein
MAKEGFGCERPECCSSTGICGATTFGTGELSAYGYWQFPCEICEKAWAEWLVEKTHVSILHQCIARIRGLSKELDKEIKTFTDVLSPRCMYYRSYVIKPGLILHHSSMQKSCTHKDNEIMHCAPAKCPLEKE